MVLKNNHFINLIIFQGMQNLPLIQGINKESEMFLHSFLIFFIESLALSHYMSTFACGIELTLIL